MGSGYEEDTCECCWYAYGPGGTCMNPRYWDLDDDEITKPCGWFKPKVEEQETDEYEVYQREWN